MNYHDEQQSIERQESDFARRCMQHPHGFHGVTASVTPLQVVQLETVACEDCDGMGGDGDDPSAIVDRAVKPAREPGESRVTISPRHSRSSPASSKYSPSESTSSRFWIMPGT